MHFSKDILDDIGYTEDSMYHTVRVLIKGTEPAGPALSIE
jgi:hypothetical protein